MRDRRTPAPALSREPAPALSREPAPALSRGLAPGERDLAVAPRPIEVPGQARDGRHHGATVSPNPERSV
ncbi:hypothetical protein GCM10011392_30070 [Wenxinia marina]|nr:hypothetical protein GCM10011392_30070 [Wenxinia marina]